jgi:hypothetical protein
MNTLGEIIASLPMINQYHNHNTSLYRVLEKLARQEAEQLFTSSTSEEKSFGPLGHFYFPYFKMGAIDSVDLFGARYRGKYWSSHNGIG